jgi:hypothetical protein
MRSVQLFSSAGPRYLFTCGSLLLLLQCCAIVSTSARTLESNSKVVRVWTVGSPHTGVLPPAVLPKELQRQAQSLGLTIEIETFRAAGFAARFNQALQDHNEPEILTFDNYGVLLGIHTPLGWHEGVATDFQKGSVLAWVHEALTDLQPRGWVMLVRSAVNFEAARMLSMQPPVCKPAMRLGATPRHPDLSQVQETATSAARAYLACDRDNLSLVSDDARLGQKCFLPQSDTKVETIKTCQVSGNRNLAFVSLTSSFSADTRVPIIQLGLVHGMDLGQQSIFAVLRNQGGIWRVLAITDDSVNTVARIPVTTPSFVNLLDDGGTPGLAPTPAQLLTPDGMFPRPRPGERFGDFLWQPTQNPEVIGQVVEFMLGKDHGGRTRLFFLPSRESKLSSGLIMGGTSVWRVWSVSKSGEIAFSEQYSYRN